MIIPRGGAGLHEFCRENSHIPVITGGIGICHLFVDDTANPGHPCASSTTPRSSGPRVCNALGYGAGTRRHRARISTAGRESPAPGWCYIPGRAEGILCLLAAGSSASHPPGAEDFDTEWLSLVLGLKVVDGLDEAIEHIAAHSTAHSDGILTSTEATQSALSRKWTRPRCTSTPVHASPTARSWAWARRWLSPPNACTPAVPWDYANSPRTSGSSAGRGM